MALRTVTFTLDDSLLALLVPAVCALYGYQATLPDGTANPQTPDQFVGQHFVSHGINITKAYAAKQADAARVQALAQVDAAVEASPPTFTMS